MKISEVARRDDCRQGRDVEGVFGRAVHNVVVVIATEVERVVTELDDTALDRHILSHRFSSSKESCRGRDPDTIDSRGCRELLEIEFDVVFLRCEEEVVSELIINFPSVLSLSETAIKTLKYRFE